MPDPTTIIYYRVLHSRYAVVLTRYSLGGMDARQAQIELAEIEAQLDQIPIRPTGELI